MRFAGRILGLGLGVAVAGSMAIAREEGKGSPVREVAGSYTFRTYCASCHGVKGKGDGPLAESLRFHPPDLTQLAKENDGEYPAEMVRQVIDGRKPIAGHGGPDMPVWGDAFKNVDTGYDEKGVEQKIQSLVDYLKTIQE
jgi:mono/diheme cytochrome c family protein